MFNICFSLSGIFQINLLFFVGIYTKRNKSNNNQFLSSTQMDDERNFYSYHLYCKVHITATVNTFSFRKHSIKFTLVYFQAECLLN